MEQRNTKIVRTSIIASALLVLGVIVFSLYVYVVRAQDSDYDAANAQISTMIDAAASFKAFGAQGSFNPQVTTLTELETGLKIIDDYNNSLTTLKKSPVLAKDGQVSNYYKTVQAKVADYGQSSADMVATITRYVAIKLNCNILIAGLPKVTTSIELRVAEADCKDSLAKYTNVPLADFDKSYFQSYHAAVSKLVSALEAYYAAGEADQTSKQQNAQTDITTTINQISALNESNDFPIKNTANPTTELNKLKDLLTQRRNTFFR